MADKVYDADGGLFHQQRAAEGAACSGLHTPFSNINSLEVGKIILEIYIFHFLFNSITSRKH